MSRFFLRIVVALITFTIGLAASAVSFGWGAPVVRKDAQNYESQYRTAERAPESRGCPSSRGRR